jgi:hypothetical protein
MLAFRLLSFSLLTICSVISAANTLGKLASSDTQLALRNMDMDKTYFIFLPDECLKCIAGFIYDSEFDEEFIEHALKLSDIPSKLRKKALSNCSDCDALLSYSVDMQKLYLFHIEFPEDEQAPYERRRKNCIESFDINTDKFKDLSVVCGKSFEEGSRPLCFAISHDEKHVAQLAVQLDFDGGVVGYAIECNKSGESEPYKIFDLSGIYSPWVNEAPSLAFNKQSTKIIISMHKKKYIDTDPRQYKLFHLTPESEHEKTYAKTFIGYLKHLDTKHKKHEKQ